MYYIVWFHLNLHQYDGSSKRFFKLEMIRFIVRNITDCKYM